MSRNTPTIDTIDDLVLGVLGSAIPPSDTVDHAVRFFSTWSGSDKLLMVVQYAAKLLVPVMQRRAELQFRAGKREKPLSLSKDGLSKLASQISLTRRISGFWGILAILKGISALERNRPSSRLVLNLQRIQALSMMLFYPLDYISFFSSQPNALLRNVSPEASAKAGLWSVRAWGVYVAVQIVLHINEWRDLSQLESDLEKGDLERDEQWDQKRAIWKKKRGILNGLGANVTRMPVILHWSFIGGLYKNEIWTDIFSLISGIIAFQGGWKASALPPPKR